MGNYNFMSIRKHRTALLALTLIALLLFAFSSLTLVKTQDRNLKYHLPASLQRQVVEDSEGMSEVQIIDYSLKLTARTLRFNADNDIPNGTANCIGYAQLCASVCNRALASNGYRCRAKPVVGYVEVFGINLCDVLVDVVPSRRWKNFVSNHDFVELACQGKTYYFDPSMYDVLDNKCLTTK